MTAFRHFMHLCMIFLFASATFNRNTLAQQSPAQQSRVVFTRQILAFHQTTGLPQWQNNIKARIMGARWQFNPDGTFLYNAPDSDSRLFPIKGKLQKKDDTLVFAGSAFIRIGSTSITYVAVVGKIYHQEDQTLISMRYMAGSGIVARVLNHDFSQNNSNAYEFTVSLR